MAATSASQYTPPHTLPLLRNIPNLGVKAAMSQSRPILASAVESAAPTTHAEFHALAASARSTPLSLRVAGVCSRAAEPNHYAIQRTGDVAEQGAAVCALDKTSIALLTAAFRPCIVAPVVVDAYFSGSHMLETRVGAAVSVLGALEPGASMLRARTVVAVGDWEAGAWEASVAVRAALRCGCMRRMLTGGVPHLSPGRVRCGLFAHALGDD